MRVSKTGAGNTVLVEIPPDLADRLQLIAELAQRYAVRNPPSDAIWKPREVFVEVREKR